MKIKVGFVGLGIMGLPMALNLVAKGFEVFVYDIDERRVRMAVEKGAVGSSFNEIGSHCKVVCISLPKRKDCTAGAHR